MTNHLILWMLATIAIVFAPAWFYPFWTGFALTVLGIFCMVIFFISDMFALFTDSAFSLLLGGMSLNKDYYREETRAWNARFFVGCLIVAGIVLMVIA